MRANITMKGLAMLALLFSAAVASAAEPPQTQLSYSIGQNNVPTLTWSNPWASSCTASGSWSGTKAPTGTETLARITGTVTYRLTCVGTVDNRATLSYQRPTSYTDGTALPATDLNAFRIYQGTSAGSLNLVSEVDDAVLSYVAQPLAAGTHYFAVSAVTVNGVESALSGVGSKTITAAPTDEEVVTVRAPNPPAPATVQ